MTFKCSASCGDIIYTLPAVKQIAEQTGERATYYIDHKTYSFRQTVNTYKALGQLLQYQKYIKECLPWNGEKVDFDFDKFRGIKYKSIPMPMAMANAIGLKDVDYNTPWLTFPMPPTPRNHVLFACTNRYKKHGIDMIHLAQELSAKENVFFVGTDDEYAAFKHLHIDRIKYPSLLHVALHVRDSKTIICNQTAILTIAQAINHPNIQLAWEKSFQNVRLGKENILE